MSESLVQGVAHPPEGRVRESPNDSVGVAGLLLGFCLGFYAY